MKNAPRKKPAPAKVPAPKAPVTLQALYDKWFLPAVFVAIGSVMAWAVWRH